MKKVVNPLDKFFLYMYIIFTMKNLKILILSLLITSFLHADVTIENGWLNQSIEVFYAADMTLETSSFQPLILRVDLENTDPVGRSVYLFLEISGRKHGRLAYGNSKEFTIPANSTVIVTNRELSDPASDKAIGDYHVDDAGDDLKDVVFKTGMLPVDTYTFRIDVMDAVSGTLLDSWSDELTVSALSFIELNSPGGPFSLDPLVVFNSLPTFQWASPATNFDFKLCELDLGQISGEEAMNNHPKFELKNFVGNVLQYPSYAEDLKDGKIYCWQVFPKVMTSGGELEIPSEIWSFRFGERREEEILPEQSQILVILSQIVGDDYETVLNQLKSDGYSPTGKLLLNGSSIDLSKFSALAQDFADGKLKLKDVNLE